MTRANGAKTSCPASVPVCGSGLYTHTYICTCMSGSCSQDPLHGWKWWRQALPDTQRCMLNMLWKEFGRCIVVYYHQLLLLLLPFAVWCCCGLNTYIHQSVSPISEQVHGASLPARDHKNESICLLTHFISIMRKQWDYGYGQSENKCTHTYECEKLEKFQKGRNIFLFRVRLCHSQLEMLKSVFLCNKLFTIFEYFDST